MKKLLSLILCAALMLCACSALAETISVTEAGFGDDVTVALTVEDGVVTNVEITGNGETSTIGGAAIPVLAEAILEA